MKIITLVLLLFLTGCSKENIVTEVKGVENTLKADSKTGSSSEKIYDFDYDDEYIYSAFLDQYGIKHITEDVFNKIINLKQTDFLFFISSVTPLTLLQSIT